MMHRIRISKKCHVDIWLFDEFGLAVIYQPGWSLYFLIGFIGINIFWRE